MTVYSIVQRIMLGEAKKAGGFADVYLARLMAGDAEAEVAASMSKECFDNAAALRIVLKELPVETAGKEV
jgi:hypothetical protein